MNAGVNAREHKCLLQTLTIILFPLEVVNRCKLKLFKELVDFYCRGVVGGGREIKNTIRKKYLAALKIGRRKKFATVGCLRV